MNALERLLQDDLNHLIDRLAATTAEGLLAGCGERQPGLSAKLAESETRVSAARHRLLEDYAQWRGALAGYNDLWEMAALLPELAPEADERRAA